MTSVILADLREHLEEVFGQSVITEDRTDLQVPLIKALESWSYPLSRPFTWSLNRHSAFIIAPGETDDEKIVQLRTVTEHR